MKLSLRRQLRRFHSTTHESLPANSFKIDYPTTFRYDGNIEKFTFEESPVEQKPFESLCADYLALIRRLRKECPWDREQTHESLRSPLIEEAYETAEAITGGQLDHLRNELGDLLLHIFLQSVIAEEEQAFTISDVLTYSMDKLIRRHPHVFGSTEVEGAGDVTRNWEMIKRNEGKTSLSDGVPMELPALVKAQRIQSRASVLGFDWDNKKDVWIKVQEEIEELAKAEAAGDATSVEREFGDLLFALVNYSRFIAVNAEFALRTSTDKFLRRFAFIEDELRKRGKNPTQSSFGEMDTLWNEAKKVVG